MNSGIGAMGPYNHANATIGRAYGLLSQNLQGGSVPGDTYMGSLGNWYDYTAVASRRPRSAAPGSRSMCRRASSRPTAPRASSSAGGTPCRLRPARHVEGEDAALRCAAVEQYSPPLIVMDPIVARGFVDLGFDTQGEADRVVRRERAAARARILGQPVDADCCAPMPWLASSRTRHAQGQPDEIIRIFEPEEINVVVAGGETQGAWKMIGGSLRATVSIDEWR